jgi:hypothetical protein
MSSDPVGYAPDQNVVRAKVAEARLVMQLSELETRYGGVLMHVAEMRRPALHAALCQQRAQLEALIAGL